MLSTSNIRRLCRRGFFLESRTLLNKPWGCLIPLDESQPGEKPTPKTNILHTSLQHNSSSLLLFTYSSDEGTSYRTIKTISMNGGGLNVQNVNLEKANLQSVLPALLLYCLRKRKKSLPLKSYDFAGRFLLKVVLNSETAGKCLGTEFECKGSLALWLLSPSPPPFPQPLVDFCKRLSCFFF